ncbi:unnamed protein product [Moneuplotes crassus]|uniref:Uncharacterized protein n=1 Tax=Euplotes crassus TaxID=5936 RepID=A0AAD1X511_EUPCR|nr:unnamed protein product [Moneuplotes crassus]
MKDISQKTYDADIESLSRESLRFYKKINLETYKNMFLHSDNDESSMSNTNMRETNEFQIQNEIKRLDNINESSFEQKSHQKAKKFGSRDSEKHFNQNKRKTEKFEHKKSNKEFENSKMFKSRDVSIIYDKRQSDKHPFDFDSYSSLIQPENDYCMNPKITHRNQLKFVKNNDDNESSERHSSLQRFCKDARRKKGKILSFSKPKNIDSDPLGFEIVGPCPSIKLYSGDAGNTSNNISTEELKLLCTKNTNNEVSSSDLQQFSPKYQKKNKDEDPNSSLECKEIGIPSHQEGPSDIHSSSYKNKKCKKRKTSGKNRRRDSRHTPHSVGRRPHKRQDEGEKPLTTREVMQIMNTQIQSIRNEFIAVLQSINTRIDTTKTENTYFQTMEQIINEGSIQRKNNFHPDTRNVPQDSSSSAIKNLSEYDYPSQNQPSREEKSKDTLP